MRPIDADALIEKCGGWYVDECTESGFIGTLENLLATEPTIQPQSTTGQLNDGARSTAQSTDLIDRQAVIDAINHICPVDAEYDCTLLDRVDVRYVLSDLPSVQPEPKEGHWIGCDGSYICSECNGSPIDFIGTMGISFDAYVETPMNYCPNCGARMKGERQK